jgi:hypothetical protein
MAFIPGGTGIRANMAFSPLRRVLAAPTAD